MSTGEQPALTVVERREGVAALLPSLRRQILSRLHDESDSATGLSRKLGLPRQRVNYHVRALERAGFLELEAEQKRRGCTERRFRPTARAYLISPDLLGELGEQQGEIQDRFSSAYLITMAARIIRDVATLRRKADQARKKLATFGLEVEIRFQSPAERAAFAGELADAVAGLAARYQDDSQGSRSYRFVVGGHPVLRNKDRKGDPDGYAQKS